VIDKEGYEYKTEPYAHQVTAFEQGRTMVYQALLAEMGTGKSKIICDTVAYLYGAGKINALLIFGNNGSYTNWATDEIPTHMPDRVERNVVVWKGATGKRYKRMLDSLLTPGVFHLQVLVMNIEALAFDSGFDMALRFARCHQTMTVIDESTTIKNHKAKRTKAAIRIGYESIARRILTGSAVTNNPLDIYSQAEFLSTGCLGFTSWYAFRAQYAELQEIVLRESGRKVKVVTGYRTLDKLTADLQRFSFIIKKEDCLDLPPKVYEKYKVELTPEQTKLYEQLRKTSVAQLESEEYVTAKVVLTKLLRLHQLVCGHLTDDDGTIHKVSSNRLTALNAVLDEVSGPVIVWANYRADIHDIAENLRKRDDGELATYFGDTSDAERIDIRQRFQQGAIKYLVCNPQTAGYGLTLTASSNVIYYSNNFDAEKRQQSEDRCHRIGQTKSVTYVDLYCPKTVDEKILKALRTKKALADKVLVSTWRELLA
jgi:SNF2 family DNA or RNA helicase